jgi:phosphohistidine swiveling domain-containing protein
LRAVKDAAMICLFGDLTPARAKDAGGKGRILARLYQAGYRVPDGFVVLTSAFDADALKPDAWAEARAALARLRGDGSNRAFAVRSSALAEDSARASFAGEFQTVLDVRDDESVRRAIETVRQSRHAGRVEAYAHAQGLDANHDVAVIVQQMVAPRFSGVLFTVDPVTGSHSAIVGNYVRGVGEKLVAGEVIAAGFTLSRLKGRYAGASELRPFARSLFRLAMQLEKALGTPQDIEWAIADGQLFVLQSRPITTLREYDPATGEWNTSLTGDFLWTNANVGEAVPDVMTPCTWSFVQIFIAETMSALFHLSYPPIGNIGGRLYMNLSLMATMLAGFGVTGKRFAALSEQVFGRVPAEVEIPTVPMSRSRIIWTTVTAALSIKWRIRTNRKRLPAFLAEAPAQCDALRARISAASSPRELIEFWRWDLLPFFRTCCRMLEAGARSQGNPALARRRLQKLVGEADTNALLSGHGTRGGDLASLGPLVGLEQLARGEIDRATYARQFGHRGPHELEVSIARPGEDSAWIDLQLAGLRQATTSVATLLARQGNTRSAAWERFRQCYPRRLSAMRHRLDKMADAARGREAARSEVVRVFWVLRAFVQRAGTLTGQGEAIFFLSIEEILALLGGDPAAVEFIPARQITYARYRALPAYPALIRGRFDPARWAADQGRRGDLFDSRGEAVPASDAITGFPGAAGVVEGVVRMILSVDDGDQLQAGEVLVTTTTNVGWTPLFPRMAAIVTDVGAPLSHAAIVARELGIPAVVGCGNATMRLHTGDRVRVNGARGTVELLQAAGVA